MGENERWAEPGGQLPNGLLPGAGPVMRALDTERWSRAEERTAELIARIQPNQLSEACRNAVADYVQRLIMECFPSQVCTFGSVPLKTYLPDGDIDLTAFSHDQNLKDTWANLVCDMLENEEKNENAEFRVKEVQYIQAEVKIIKCLVENIVVDISFNQVGGLCTLCFLDEVDNLINRNHLFKRSVILIKAWCYYESRILGAHHGLISTYALETLVLYIFHVYNNSFHGPLEVLYRFLDFFSNFDWDNFCVSLWGPVPIGSLPDITAEAPRKDSGELLLSKMFLDACSAVYAVFPGGLENNRQPFVSKHFNVIDPLRVNNNLGRSVSKGNFFRIRSAFAFGAKRLARLLDCPKENLISEVNKFFTNTWERHGSGHRPDTAGSDSWHQGSSTPDVLHDLGKSNNTSGNKVNENSSIHEKEDKEICGHGISSQHGRISSKMMPMASELSTASHIQNLKSQNADSIQADQMRRDNISEQVSVNDKIQRGPRAEHLVNDTQGHFLFAPTHSSPILTNTYSDLSSQTRCNRKAETANAHDTSARLDTSDRKKNQGSEGLGNHISCTSVEDTSSVRHALFQQSLDTSTTGSNCGLNSSHRDLGLDALSEEFSSTSGAPVMHQEKQDIVNMMASASLQGFDGQFHVPFNLNSAHMPFSIPPSFLASMGYNQRNLSGFVPTNIPLINAPYTNVQFTHGLVSPQLTQYFHGYGANSLSEASFEQSNENFDAMEMKSEEVDSDFWQDQDICSFSSYDPENGNFDMHQYDDKPPASVPDSKYVPSPRVSSSAGAMRVRQRHTREKRGTGRQNSDNLPIQDDRSSEVYAEERSVSSRFSSATHCNALRSRTSSESSWDGSSVKAPKSTKEKRGKKAVSVDLPTRHGKGKIMSEQVLNQVEDDDEKWGSFSSKGTEMVERNPGSEPVASLQVPRQHAPGFEVAQISGTDSTMPFAPMLIDPGPGHRMNDNSGLMAFYPTGPPIPFLTMLPVYNVPSEKATSDASSGHFEGDENLKNSETVQKFSPVEFDHSEDLSPSSSLRGSATAKTSDILNSDFTSHWQNLQLGRFCQDPRHHGPLLYPSPLMVSPAYLQGRFPYDNPGRPLSTNANIFSQLMTNHGHRLVPLAPLQSVSGRPLNVYRRYMDDMPRYRSGTGTYLPNPKVSVKERHSSGTRRGSYSHDRNDNYGDREGNWNANSKSRAAGRNHSRGQNDESNLRADRLASVESRSDHSWNSHRQESIPSNHSHNSPLSSNSNINGPQNVVYSTYPLAAPNPDRVSNGPSVPPVMVLYPFDDNAAQGSHGEQLEFGSLGPVDLPGADEPLHLNEGSRSRTVEDHRLHGSSGHRSSPDQPSSPHLKRRV